MKKLLSFALFCASYFYFTQLSLADEASYKVAATKLDESRKNIVNGSGATSYSFDQKDIDNLPQSDFTGINQVLLRAPSVVQDSYSQIHIRGDHSGAQYRINDVMIPKPISGFGQMFDTRIADSVELLTGALPAAYGYKTAGVVSIKTKNAFKNGGSSEITVGGNNTLALSQQIYGLKDNLNYFVSGSHTQNSRGIESPTSDRNSVHNDTRQDKILGYFSKLLDVQTRASLVIGASDNNFQVPNNPNQQKKYTSNIVGDIASDKINEKQSETNSFVVFSLQGITDFDLDYQIAPFVRSSVMKFRSDYVGDLIYNGVAADTDRSSFVGGIQSDFSYKINDANILRSGFFFGDERTKSAKNNFVFLGDAESQTITSQTLQLIYDNFEKRSQIYGLYLQDEIKVLKNFTINFGARFDASKSYANESQLSPRVGAVYDFSKDTKFHAGYAKYFTPPQNELLSNASVSKFQGTTNAAHNSDNSPVKSERQNYYDAGISHKFSKYFEASLDAYYKQIQNMLDEARFGQALIYSPFNYRYAKSYGSELSLNYKKENFSSFFNFAMQRTRAKEISSAQYLFEEDKINLAKDYIFVDHDQTYTASAGASYRLDKDLYSVDAIYGSGLRRENQTKMGGYVQFNAAIARDFDLDYVSKFNARISVANLFDKVYRIRDGSGISVAAPSFGPRRTLYLTLKKEF